MNTLYLVAAVLLALMVAFSGLLKIRRDPRSVKVIHETIGVPLAYFPLLALCEFAGALGLLAGIWWPPFGVAAAAGLVVYFLGAIGAHVRVGDGKGIVPAAFMSLLAAGMLLVGVLRR